MRRDIENANKKDEIYFKISPVDFIEVNRALLEVKASAISMQLRAEKLKQGMKEEIKKRGAVKRNYRAIFSSFNSLNASLPKVKEIQSKKEVPIHHVPVRLQVKTKEEHKENDLERQLNDLKKKISTL